MTPGRHRTGLGSGVSVAFGLFVLTVLLGCASAPPLLPGNVLPGGFALSARLGVRHGEQGFTGGLTWRHGQGADEIRFHTPLGQMLAELELRPAHARLRLADRVVEADEAGALMARELGWSLPLAGLPDWVRGLPRAQTPHVAERDASGRLSRLQQDGWEITYPAYQEEPPQRPRRLVMKSADLELRLVIDRWEENPWQ